MSCENCGPMCKEQCTSCTSDDYNNKYKGAFSMLPPNALLEVCKVFEYGSYKYSRGSWQSKPYTVSKHIDAAGRHLIKSALEDMNPEDADLYHLAQAATRCLMALEQILTNKEIMDDRKELK